MTVEASFVTTEQLEQGLQAVLESPRGEGTLEAIFLRLPGIGRRAPREARLSPSEGVDGDRWKAADGDPDTQVTLMNARILDLISGGDRERWSEAGDQLIVDMDLSLENLAPGQRLGIGDAVLEVATKPHTGCGRFSSRYGAAAARFIGAPERAGLRLRALHLKCRNDPYIGSGLRFLVQARSARQSLFQYPTRRRIVSGRRCCGTAPCTGPHSPGPFRSWT